MKQETDVLRVPSLQPPENNKLSITKQRTIENIKICMTVTAYIGIMTLGFFGLGRGLSIRPFYMAQRRVAQCTEIANQAIYKSGGEDRIWTDQEKREFLDFNGLEDAILQKGQNIYLRADENGVDVFGGNVYGNSRINHLGRIPQSKLQAYINSTNLK